MELMMFHQLSKPKYPLSRSGPNGRMRSFQEVWFKRFRWLEYSETKDAAYCLPCYLFNKKPVGRVGSDRFTKPEFNKWKKLNGGNDCAFIIHVGSDERPGSKNQGNLLELAKLIASYNKDAIRDEIGNAKFCLIVDESRDESKKEQMAIVVRFVDRNGNIKERFLDLRFVNARMVSFGSYC
ncbi:zinc finger MYM-type protein 1-like protein [Tanacetum coccineum]